MTLAKVKEYLIMKKRQASEKIEEYKKKKSERGELKLQRLEEKAKLSEVKLANLKSFRERKQVAQGKISNLRDFKREKLRARMSKIKEAYESWNKKNKLSPVNQKSEGTGFLSGGGGFGNNFVSKKDNNFFGGIKLGRTSNEFSFLGNKKNKKNNMKLWR